MAPDRWGFPIGLNEYILDIFGRTTGDVWFVDSHGRTHSFDDSRWTVHGFRVEDDAKVTDTSALSKSSAWATVEEGVMLRYDGTEWKLFTAPGATRLDAVHAHGENQVWAIGDVLVAHNGTTWTTLADAPTQAEKTEFVGIDGTSDTQLQTLPRIRRPLRLGRGLVHPIVFGSVLSNLHGCPLERIR